MTARESSATERALARVAGGESVLRAAEAESISRSTLQRAMRRHGQAGRTPAKGAQHRSYIDGRTRQRAATKPATP